MPAGNPLRATYKIVGSLPKPSLKGPFNQPSVVVKKGYFGGCLSFQLEPNIGHFSGRIGKYFHSFDVQFRFSGVTANPMRPLSSRSRPPDNPAQLSPPSTDRYMPEVGPPYCRRSGRRMRSQVAA